MKQNLDSTMLGRFGEPGILVLFSLAEGPKHGYAMIGDIFAQTGLRLGPGTLYGAIGRLMERGLIEPAKIEPAKEEDRRRPYQLTPSGRAALAEHIATWSHIMDVGRLRLAL